MRSLLIYLFFIFLSCTEQNNSPREEEKILSFLSEIKSDCIYCTNTQAFAGDCTCFEAIAVGSCAGMSSGEGKSNSYKISCQNLTAAGFWTTVPGGKFCMSSGCPPEAYRAAFSETGL